MLNGNLFNIDCNAICIPTNGYVTSSGSLVMGAGVARQAADRWPALPELLGQRVYQLGNAVHLITTKGPRYQFEDSAFLGTGETPYHIVSFPTKPSRINIGTPEDVDKVLARYRPEAETLLRAPRSVTRDVKYLPGWKAKSDIALIKHSAEELVELTNTQGWKKVCLPRVGCGAGEMDWHEVYDLLKEHLDNRFIIVHNR